MMLLLQHRKIAATLLLVVLASRIATNEAFLPAITPRGMKSMPRVVFMSTPTKEDKELLTSDKNDTRPELNMMAAPPPVEELPATKKDEEATKLLQQPAPSKTKLRYDELDGEAKREEPGDRDRIATLIKQYEFEIWDQEPSIPVETIVQRTLDTAEDAFLHLRRVPYDKGWFLETPKEDKPTVVVLGSGWAAHALLKVIDTYKMRIIVVSPSNHFVFTPMLASASVGTVEYRSMTEAVRAANPMISNYLEGTATGVDLEQQTLTVKMNSLLNGIKEPGAPEIQVKYDKLIVGTYSFRVFVYVCDCCAPDHVTDAFIPRSCGLQGRRLAGPRCV